MSTLQTGPNDKKSRLSRILGKRDKTPERPTNLPDSAYASSETPSGEAFREKEKEKEKENVHMNMRPHQEMVPAEKGSEIANIDKDKNLALQPETGEVFDRDTGEVVTVVTTTTTTTTTTTRRPGHGGPPSITNDVQRETQQAPPITTSAAPGGALIELPANTAPISQQPGPNSLNTSERPAITGPSLAPSVQSPPIPTEQSATTGPSLAPSVQSPPIPTKSPNRRSMEVPADVAHRITNPSEHMDDMPGTYRGTSPPASPSRPNFSYPSRAPPTSTAAPTGLAKTDRPMQHDRNTIQDLKSAAKGLHGVGETLRGTFSSTIDKRFPSRDAEKAALVNSRNDRILAKGRDEMSAVQRNRPNAERDATPPGAWPEEHVPEIGPQRAPANATTPGTSAAPAATDNTDLQERQKAKSISKLFKRKPVNSSGDELRVTNP